VALGRKNHLFAGSNGGAERWATVCSLIASAKLNDVEPFTYLKDILQRMTEGHPMSRLDELLPWNWPQMRVKHQSGAIRGRLRLNRGIRPRTNFLTLRALRRHCDPLGRRFSMTM
jgi:IS66 C-terminal element